VTPSQVAKISSSTAPHITASHSNTAYKTLTLSVYKSSRVIPPPIILCAFLYPCVNRCYVLFGQHEPCRSNVSPEHVYWHSIRLGTLETSRNTQTFTLFRRTTAAVHFRVWVWPSPRNQTSWRLFISTPKHFTLRGRRLLCCGSHVS
jgi:hypothetical protein